MTPGHSGRETEIKLRVPDAAAAISLVEAAGFRIQSARTLESDAILDFDDGRLQGSHRLLRLRRRGARALLTYKGTPEPGRHKSREELEIELSSLEIALDILSRLGLSIVFRYEKYRTEYAQGDVDGLVLFDETPIGVFLELEGLAGWIDETARSLGFTESDYITASYARLYAEHRERHPDAPADMVFEEE
jgi:adenylate cyclase class 2